MKIFSRILVLALICVLLTSCACPPKFENPVVATEPATTMSATTEPVPTEPAVRTLPPEEITMDMFRLAEHNPNGEHCTTCSPFCMEHCFKSKCILHCQEYMGLYVTVPSCELYVVGQAMSNDKEGIQALKECGLDNLTIMNVTADETFQICGIRYVSDTAGSPDPEMVEGSEWDGPFTLEEMSNFCSAGWIDSTKNGILYVILGETTYAVLPFTLEVSYQHP